MPGLKNKGGFGDLRGVGRGMAVGESGKEKGIGLDTVPDRGTGAGVGVEDKSQKVTRAATRAEGGPVGKRKATGVETGTGPATWVGDRTGVNIGAGLGTRARSKTGDRSRKEFDAGMGAKSGLGAEDGTENRTGVWARARRHSVIGTGTRTEARTGFGGASGFTAELIRSSGSVLKKRRQSISSQFYY